MDSETNLLAKIFFLKPHPLFKMGCILNLKQYGIFIENYGSYSLMGKHQILHLA